ncbi:Alcohol acetyltransferase [Hirsutella rhossiliensis]|uniref:Alcohol acetyltransferase n=1 Tax=Hirsutella rhossiliensis TaxID=111463 RepID=A0A9P8N9G0_9HYPO|nr:Alcohol acetyltransferase [Hirsutella rhossiliensis]KAH0968441.1 Alcohol acetyltransferase [Hirsutella rhossiliensis]
MDPPSAPQTPLRPLSNMELFSCSRHHLGIYRCVAITCRYTHSAASSPSPPALLDASVLYPALATLVSAQPMLRVGILGQDRPRPRARFSHLARLDLRAHVSFDTLPAGADYEGQLARRQGWLHDQLWPDVEVCAPWRLVVLRPGPGPGPGPGSDSDSDPPPFYDVIFAFHHSLMDGSSGKAFHEHLLAALNNPSLSSSLPFLLGAVWSEHAPQFLRPAAPWHGKAIDFSIPHRTRTLAIDMAPDVVAALVAACRAQGTSLTGLVHALVLASFALRLCPDASCFAASTPINLRPYLDPDTSDPSLRPLLRSLVTGHSHHFPPWAVAALREPDASLDGAIWSAARHIKRELAQRLATLPADDPAGLLGYIGDWFAFWRAKDGRPRAESWEVSNIGVLSGGGAAWSIERVFFTNGAMVAGPPLGVNMATAAPAGTLTASLSWQDTVIPDGFAEQLAADLASLTRHFHETGKFSF